MALWPKAAAELEWKSAWPVAKEVTGALEMVGGAHWMQVGGALESFGEEW